MRFELVIVGTSLGGLNALETLLAGLPAHFRLPVAIVQHRSRDSDDTLRSLLQHHCALPVEEVTDKAPILPGCVYLAPSNYHVLIEPGNFALSTEAPVAYSRPSIDVLFESAALAYGSRLIGVILTGANADGAFGACRIKEQGGWIIVQDPRTAESRIMPEAALAATTVDQVLPLEEISSSLIKLSQ
jgi:two-component system chemotaxis response regulator CheB